MSLLPSHKVEVNGKDKTYLLENAVRNGCLTGSFLRYYIAHGFWSRDQTGLPCGEPEFDDIDFYVCNTPELRKPLTTVTQQDLVGGCEKRKMGKTTKHLSSVLTEWNRSFCGHQHSLYTFYKDDVHLAGLLENIPSERLFPDKTPLQHNQIREQVLVSLQKYKPVMHEMRATVNVILVDEVTFRAWNMANTQFIRFLIEDFGFLCSSHQKEFRKGFFEGLMGAFLANQDHGY